MKNRREFLKSGIGASAALSLSRPQAAQAQMTIAKANAFKPLETVRIGFVGIGVKGSQHLGILMNLEGVEIRAVCDVLEGQCREAQAQVKRLGKPEPKAYFNGDWDFKRMCEEEDLDLVYTATPWKWHTPVCLAAMENGIHAATEIPMATTIEDCWKLVEASERTGKHCVMMENVNYMSKEMMFLNMVRKGVFGEVMHAEGAYCHDTRYLKIKDEGDGLWLGDHHAMRNGNLYPPHGIGPMAWYMDVNRGDRLDYMVSMSSNARGMDLYVKEHLPEGHPKRERRYINGDVNFTLIKTVNGRTMILKHDTDLPRPYSRVNLIQGTRGIGRSFPEFKIYLERNADRSDTGTAFRSEHKWSPGSDYESEYEHPLHAYVRENNLGGNLKDADFARIGRKSVWEYRPEREFLKGDFMENYRLVEALRKGVATDYDVYDAAVWSAVSPLSEWSVANRSRPIDFPDFTRGKWMTAKPPVIMGV